MSGLNDSVILCDAFSKASRKKAPLGSKKPPKTIKKSFYDSPLRHIQLSSKRWEQLKVQKKSKRNIKKALKNKESLLPSAKEDSVIILSDNECESNKEESESRMTRSKSKKRPLQQGNEGEPVIQFSVRNSDKTQKQREIELKTQPKKRRKIETDKELDISCLLISDAEDSDTATVEIDDVDDENIAPLNSLSQGSDDIVVVWSSTKGSPSKNQSIENPTDPSKGKESPEEKSKCPNSQEDYNRVFMIDCNPTIHNLSCISNQQPQETQCSTNTKQNYETYDSDLLFNKPGLVLPEAKDISDSIVMDKPRSSVFTLRQQFNQHLSNSPSITVTATEAFTTQFVSQPPKGLREIVIDGSNIAMAHKNGKLFSEEGIMLVIDYFKQRGHTVKVFVPQCRRSFSRPFLEKWYKDGIVVFTPSRYIGGRWITSYDDRFILQYATMCGGIVISSDQYRDLYKEKPEWRDTIEKRLLAPTFVGDIVMFPEDPLGRRGPKLDEFLRHEVGKGSIMNELCK